VVDLSNLGALFKGNSQTDPNVPVPEGQYDANNMKISIVPNRGMILLSAVLGLAIAKQYAGVSYGIHAGNHEIYPDCRPEFVDAMNVAAKLADWHKVEIFRPFLLFTKAGIVKRGAQLGVDFAGTWSCYKGEAKHCGKCGPCLERREAFQLALVNDPTEYE
jgi:7-cyano-7-deazaguanine synthase